MIPTLKKLVKSNSFWIIFIVLVVFMIPAIYSPSEFSQKAIVSAMGIDKSGDEYEVSFLLVIPNATPNAVSDSVEIVSAKGKSVAEAIHSISLNIGKIVGLAHCDSIVVSDEVLQEDLQKHLDYLNRSSELTKNAMIINTPKSSKEVLQTTVSTKTVPSLELSSVVEYNREYTFHTNASIDAFYTEYFMPSKVTLVPVVEVEENKQQSSSSDSGGSSSGEGGQSEKSDKKLSCKGDICVIKEGKKVATLTGNELIAYSVLNPDTSRGFVYLQDVNIDDETTADVTLEIRRKDVSKKASFENGKPKLTYKGKVLFRLVEVVADDPDLQIIDKVSTKLTDAIQDEFLAEVIKDLEMVHQSAIASNADLFLADNVFSAFKAKEWQKYKNNLTNEQDFIKDLQFEVDIDFEGKY